MRDGGTDSADTAGFLFGVALGISVFGALLTSPHIAKAIEVRAIPLWVTIVAGILLLGGATLWSVRARTPLPVVMFVLSTPLLVAATVVRLVEPNPAWAVHMRAAGLALVVSVSLAMSLVYGRRKRELERAVFNEATTIAFFVTAIASATYGVLQTAFDIPRLSFLWIAIFAAACWAVCLSVVTRRYS